MEIGWTHFIIGGPTECGDGQNSLGNAKNHDSKKLIQEACFIQEACLLFYIFNYRDFDYTADLDLTFIL